MPFTITAEFPLGFYQGRNTTGQVEETPTPLRLLSALVAAAGSGVLAEETAEGLRISARSQQALEWLEGNPPDQISLPELTVNDPGVTAFKVLGLRTRDRFDVPTAKDAVARTSLNGPVHWRWNDAPPETVLKTIDQLLAEVPYLGEAASPVRLTSSSDAFELPDHLQLSGTDQAGPLARTVAVPSSGRLAALEELHLQLMKSGASNASVKDESEMTARWPDQGIRQLWYEPHTPPQTHTNPWSEAFIVEARADSSGATGWPPAPRDYVRWSIALHRTLIRVLGQDVPPGITGHHVAGLPRPANNVAIQIVLRDDNVNHEWSSDSQAAFVVLVPDSASADDRAAVYQALLGVAQWTIRPTRSQAARVTGIHRRTAADFWRPPAKGHSRFWTIRPLGITETRPLHQNAMGTAWTLNDAIQLSVGMTWRDEFQAEGRGELFYRALAAEAGERMTVLSQLRVHGSLLHRYVHKAQPSIVITGYRGLLDMGALLADTAPAAIGQSRHVGGGFLVPVDVPQALLDETGKPLWL